jgi:hypothetical protein
MLEDTAIHVDFVLLHEALGLVGHILRIHARCIRTWRPRGERCERGAKVHDFLPERQGREESKKEAVEVIAFDGRGNKERA